MIDITEFTYLKERGFHPISKKYYEHIEKWMEWYKGNVPSFHVYTVYNGVDKIKCGRATLGIAKKVCEDWGNLLMNERVNITLSDDTTNTFVHEVFENNNFYEKINEYQELKCACGTVAYIPYARNIVTKGDKVQGDIGINYVQASNIIPLSCKNGEITECAFKSYQYIGDDIYMYLQIHYLKNGKYCIDNMWFQYKEGQISNITDQNVLNIIKRVKPTVMTNQYTRTFTIDKLNIHNHIDVNSPMGVSIFANAIDTIKGIDLIYDSYLNEFSLGKKRIMVKSEATQFNTGDPVFDSNDVVFYRLPDDVTDELFIKEIDMSLRIAEHQTGMRDHLGFLSSKCGLGENYYRFDSGSLTTATQVISDNSTLYRTLKKHEIPLERAIKELIVNIVRLGIDVLKKPLNMPEYKDITIDFDDSIIEDKEAELASMRLDVSSGILNPEVYLAKKYGVTEEQAKALMPSDQGIRQAQVDFSE